MTEDPATPAVGVRLLPESYVVLRLEADARVPASLPRSSLLSITRTANELSIVCVETEDLPGRIESGWRCLEVLGPLAFDQVGILASLATPLAESAVSIFALSTFDTDYLLVKEAQLEPALTALRRAGHQII